MDEPFVPRLTLGQAATLYTDAGGQGVAGTVTFISPRAEFTPRNVQTAEERSRLVYRIKVSGDNRNGLFKPGMPVEAESLGCVRQVLWDEDRQRLVSFNEVRAYGGTR